MLDSHLGMVEGPDGAARGRLGGGDAASLARIALVPFLAAAPPRRGPCVALLAFAAAIDAADGALARRTGPTRLGRDLDTVGDALMAVAAARSARRAGWLARPQRTSWSPGTPRRSRSLPSRTSLVAGARRAPRVRPRA
jgi:hypothetical protein